MSKPITLKHLGKVAPERMIYGTAQDGQPFVTRLRVWCDGLGFFEVDPNQPRAALIVGDFMTTKLHASTWRSICALFE